MEPIQRIEQRMSAKNISTYKLAQITGLTRSTVNDVFKHRNPTLSVLCAMCAALNLEVNLKPTKQQ